MLLPNGGEPRGLYLDMPPWQASIFALTRKAKLALANYRSSAMAAQGNLVIRANCTADFTCLATASKLA